MTEKKNADQYLRDLVFYKMILAEVLKRVRIEKGITGFKAWVNSRLSITDIEAENLIVSSSTFDSLFGNNEKYKMSFIKKYRREIKTK